MHRREPASGQSCASAAYAGFVADTIHVEPFRLTWPSGAASGASACSTASRMIGQVLDAHFADQAGDRPDPHRGLGGGTGVAPIETAASNRCTSMAPKPARDRMTRTFSPSANANGPGASGSAGAGAIRSAARAADSGAIAHALSRGARQQTNTHRPPARSEPRKWLKACGGLAEEHDAETRVQ